MEERATPSSPPPSPPPSSAALHFVCVVCRRAPRSHLVQPCFHLCLCVDCAAALPPLRWPLAAGQCPLCCHAVTRVDRVYFS